MTRARTSSGGGDGTTRTKEEGVGVEADFALVLDGLEVSVEPPVTRLDPMQVAGI
jgi:hypothetical protein